MTQKTKPETCEYLAFKREHTMLRIAAIKASKPVKSRIVLLTKMTMMLEYINSQLYNY